MDYKWIALALLLAFAVQSVFYMSAKTEIKRQDRVIAELHGVLTPSQKAEVRRHWETRQDMMDPDGQGVYGQ